MTLPLYHSECHRRGVIRYTVCNMGVQPQRANNPDLMRQYKYSHGVELTVWWSRDISLLADVNTKRMRGAIVVGRELLKGSRSIYLMFRHYHVWT